MKKFSEALTDDRDFEVGGELFRWRYPFWEEMAGILDEDVALLRDLEKEDRELLQRASDGALNEDGSPPGPLPSLVDSKLPSTTDTTARLFERILIFIDPEESGHTRFKALTKRKKNPVPLFLYTQLYQWLLRETSGRPTPPPSGSQAGDGSTEATSSARSRSRAATPAG